ncbi:MAG: hypothetical protein OEW67_01605 [Cyclobacteriaceae bacterium]|nr:hypothetical protein [Cyclobacteriaceae bacterium]
MKKQELPQDKSALEGYTRDICYVKNKDGKYEKALSTGWNIKAEALDNAWDDINHRIEDARNAVINGEKSPIYYFFELRLMDMQVITGYTGFWRFTVKRHMKPHVFKKLSDKKLQKYADAFDISLEELKNFNG